MTWTPDAPPSGSWSKQTTTPSSWSPDAPPFAEWDLYPSANTHRLTEDGRHRVVEDSPVRVIRVTERSVVTWAHEPPPYNPWITS